MAGIYLGPIDEIDYKRRIVDVPCGEVWIPPSIPLERFRPGTRVELVYDQSGDRRQALELKRSYVPSESGPA